MRLPQLYIHKLLNIQAMYNIFFYIFPIIIYSFHTITLYAIWCLDPNINQAECSGISIRSRINIGGFGYDNSRELSMCAIGDNMHLLAQGHAPTQHTQKNGLRP